MLKSIMISGAFILALPGITQAGAPMAFDVAEDHTRIYMAETPVHENGMPAHGNAFISQGYIYPAGTLEAKTAGVLEDGSPAFPDLVLGTWTCDGYFVGEGANATTGVWVISRQVFAFEDGATIITQGPEIADMGVENRRPITGATGEYADAGGAMVQTLLGLSENLTVNVSFRIEGAASDQALIVPSKTVYTAADARPGAIEYDAPTSGDDYLEFDSGAPVGPIDFD